MALRLTKIDQSLTRYASSLADVRHAAGKFIKIDGPLFAAAFSHYAFFSLFPLIVLFATVASVFIDRNRATARIIHYVEQFIPIGLERQAYIFDIVTTVMSDREEAGVLSLVLLLWAGSRFLSTLIRATNRAWGGESHHWWRLPFKGVALLLLLASAASLGVAVPAVLRLVDLFPGLEFEEWAYTASSYGLRFFITVLGLSLFYKLAPRRNISLGEVWLPAVAAASLLQVLDLGFGLYLRNFASLSAIYGAFGSIVALLLWIYLSGCVFIFGACLCAVRSARRHQLVT